MSQTENNPFAKLAALGGEVSSSLSQMLMHVQSIRETLPEDQRKQLDEKLSEINSDQIMAQVAKANQSLFDLLKKA